MRLLDKNELKELIVKCWMTHDGLWFYHCLQECGMEKTSKVNQAAARAIGAVEVKRIMRVLGKEKIETFEELMEFVLDGLDVIRGSFMDFSSMPPPGTSFAYGQTDALRTKASRRWAPSRVTTVAFLRGWRGGWMVWEYRMKSSLRSKAV
jgi:hypothetical protein